MSAAIKEYLTSNPDVGPTAAAEAISKQVGKKVPSSYVSNIKSTMKDGKPQRKAKRGRKRRSAVASNGAVLNGHLDLSTIQSMKSIVAKDGAATAKGLIDVLA